MCCKMTKQMNVDSLKKAKWEQQSSEYDLSLLLFLNSGRH